MAQSPVYDPETEQNPAKHSTPPSAEGLQHITGISGDDAKTMEANAAKHAEGGGFYNKGDEASKLSALGDSAASGGFFKGLAGKLRITNKRRAAATGGGFAVTIVALFFGFSFVSGPLEFVHMAQDLEKSHFGNMKSTEDNRLFLVARFARDPSKPQNTRLGVVGTSIANKLETRMNKSGIQSAYTQTLGYDKGYVVDRTNDKYKNKPRAQIRAEIIAQYKLDPSNVKFETINGKQVIRIDVTGMSYRSRLLLATKVLQVTNLNGRTSAVGARILGKRAAITWHPMQKWKQERLQALADKRTSKKEAKAAQKEFEQAQRQAINEGVKPIGADTRNNTADPDGAANPDREARANELGTDINDTVNAAGDAAEAAAAGDSQATKKFSSDFAKKVGGRGVGVLGGACLVYGLGSQIDTVRMENAVLPMIRIAGEIMGVGSQIQSNHDFTIGQMGQYKAQLVKKDENGKAISNYSQARSIQGENGQKQNGPDISEAGKVVGKGNPFDIFNGVPGIGDTCKALGGTGGYVLTFVLGGIPGLVIGEIQNQALKPALDAAAHYYAGDGIDPAAAGADRGNYANYGGRLGASDQALAASGTKLSKPEEQSVKSVAKSIEKDEFDSKSLAYRLFNPYDNQTLIAKVIDKQDPDVSQNFQNVATGFGGMFASALRTPASIINAVTHAEEKPYDYNFAAFGFSISDQMNPNVQNPFDNAKIAADILDRDLASDSKYIDRAAKCFGVKLSKDNDIWNVDTGTQSTDAYSEQYQDNDCSDENIDWVRIRFLILDTVTAESYDCYEGNTDTSSESCDHVGFTDTSDEEAESAPGGSVTAGETIDMDSLTKDSDAVDCAPNTKDLGVQDGYTEGNRIKIKICAISNLPSTGEESNNGFGVSGAGGNAVINSRASGAVYAMVEAAKKDGVILKARSSFRTMEHQKSLCGGDTGCAGGSYDRVAKPGTSNHQLGVAIDFQDLPSDPGPIANKTWEWLDKNAATYGYKNYPAEAWHWSPTGH